MTTMPEHENFWSGWQERLSALRHVPPVLRIVWRSGPLVVTMGLVLRLFASLLPIALLWIAKLIIDSIVRGAAARHPVGGGFWWLVAAESGLAVCGIFLGHPIDSFAPLLADKYARHIS